MIKDEVLAELSTVQKINYTLAPKEFFVIVEEAINDYYRREELPSANDKYIFQNPKECIRALTLIKENITGEETINTLEAAIKYLESMR